MELSKNLFSTKVTSGKRSVFFDVRNTKENRPYLKITESTLKDGQKQYNNLVVFESELANFKSAFDQAFGFLEKQVK
jgi:hypothetical protein